jgi:hypothetical protein
MSLLSVPSDDATTTTTTWTTLVQRQQHKLTRSLQGNNNTIQILSKDPLVYTISNFLSSEECQALQDYAQQKQMQRSNPPAVSLKLTQLWPLPFLALGAGIPPVYRTWQETTSGDGTSSLVLSQIIQAGLPNVVMAATLMIALAYGIVLPLIRRVTETSARTSDAVALNSVDDYWNSTRSLVQRTIQQTTHLHWEAPVVTRYAPNGARFARHNDASPTRGSEWVNQGGQRVVTCICYLNTVPHGGETYFDVLDITVRPVQGTALFFFPADTCTLLADDRTTHESLPTSPNHIKWIVQMFGRIETVPPPLGLPIEDDLKIWQDLQASAEGAAGDGGTTTPTTSADAVNGK